MLKKYILIISLIFLLTIVAGCISSPYCSKDKDYGKSYNALFQAQVINADAPENRTPVDGIPGYEAVRIYNDIYLPSVTSRTMGGVKKK